MRRRIIFMGCLLMLFLGCLFPTSTAVQASAGKQRAPTNTDFASVDPDYIYDQLSTLSTRFQRRESGYDTNLPPEVNGHDEFADYWAQEMVKNLQGFNPQIRRDPFTIAGWSGRTPQVQAFNVEVSIPGALHPEQVVIIGCHYDGMGNSQGSAYDDTSGCAIELGVAKALSAYWHAHHTYPARTLRFVIFDAEEQGLWGSFHYVSNTVHGDLSNIVAMLNEEQNGIAYPLRYLGKLSNPLLPLYIKMSPLSNNENYPDQDKLTPQQRANITHFRELMQEAVPAIFAKFQELGYLGLTYHGETHQDIPQPLFTSDQLANLKLQDDEIGSSDQVPFTLAGLPCATFVGNYTYYNGSNSPPWSFPFDQHEDTLELMNTYASGSSNKSNALTLALAIPGMLTTYMLNQPDILGSVTSDSLPAGPIAAISDVGYIQVDHDITLDASTTFDPKDPKTSLSYNWDFGDGSKSDGQKIAHSYTSPGQYTLTLSVSSPSGTRRVSKTIVVETAPPVAPGLDSSPSGTNPHNPAVIYPQPDQTLSDRIITSASELVATQSNPPPKTTPSNQSWLPMLAAVILVLLLFGGIGFVVMYKRRVR